MDETGNSDLWAPQNITETLLFYGGGIYLLAVVLAIVLWMWVRHELPRQPVTTPRGRKLHADIHERVRSRRNLLLLMLVPVLVLSLFPALVAIHPLLTGMLVAVLLVLASFVFRDAYDTISNQF